MPSSEDVSTFVEDGRCYARSLSWLKIVDSLIIGYYHSDVLQCFTTFYSVLFYLYTLTFVILSCLIVLFGGEIRVTQKAKYVNMVLNVHINHKAYQGRGDGGMGYGDGEEEADYIPIATLSPPE